MDASQRTPQTAHQPADSTDPDFRETLHAITQAPRSSTTGAFFDLDKTIIGTSAAFAFNKVLRDEGLITRSDIFRLSYVQIGYMLNGADDEQMEKIRQSIARVSTGWDARQVEEIVSRTLDEHVEPFVYKRALQLLNAHREQGHTIVILSASGETMVKHIAKMLNVEHFYATRMGIENGTYTGEIEFYCQGEGKRQAMEEFATHNTINLADSFAYSDSITDLPMLMAVGKPTAINPDRALKREATLNNWPTLTFKDTMNIGEKSAGNTAKAIVGTASLLAATSIGVTAYALSLKDNQH